VHQRLAVCAAAAALGVVIRTAPWQSVRTTLLGSRELVTAALELELGPAVPGGLVGWAELVVDQCPVLSGEKEAVLAWQQAQGEKEAPDTSVQEEQEGAAASEDASCNAPASGLFPMAGEVVPEAQPESKPQKKSKKSAGKVSASDIQIENETGKKLQLEKYWKKKPALKLRPAGEGPQILILHTHATEAYTMADGDNYKETDPQRTTDENYNVIRVGEEMKNTFEELGLSVIHDTTTYDYPGYSGSYARSLAGAQSYLDKYPTIQVILDVHRDAIIDRKGRAHAKTALIDGEETAQVMLVAGTDDGGLTHPHWRQNFTLDLAIQTAMLKQDRSLPRPIDLRSQRFNQHLTPGCTLVEVGTSGNTLRQALAGARRFARCAGEVYLTCVEEK
jgi:stage II sporulation protein P